MISSISSTSPYYSYPYSTSLNSLSSGTSTSSSSTDSYTSSNNDLYSQIGTYNFLYDGITPSMYSYMNPSSSANLPTPDQLTLQSESNTLSILQDPSSVLSTSLLNSYSQINSESTSEWNYENPNSFSLSPSQSALYTTNLFQQAYNQTTSYLNNTLGQQLNISV